MTVPELAEKNKPKRASQGKRKHIRRIKQEANRSSVPQSGNKKKVAPAAN